MCLMKNKTVTTYMKKLIKRMGSRDAVASALGITPRYVRNLEQDDLIPSKTLRKLIKLQLKL